MTIKTKQSLAKHGFKITLALLLAGFLIACGKEPAATASSVGSAPVAVLTETNLARGTANILSPAIGTELANCIDLNTRFNFFQTEISENLIVPQGLLEESTVGEHCLIKGKMNQRLSPVDGNAYAIGFEMRLPTVWNGRFFYHANGGIDGVVRTATGNLGGAQTTTALELGYAVINSDAGHQGPAPFFGLDPQARIDYGYNAVATLTPMALVSTFQKLRLPNFMRYSNSPWLQLH